MAELYTFVAGKALEKNVPFILQCNCGGTVTIMPPLQEKQVVCARCETIIKMIIVDGDPGFVIGKDADNEITLLPVQGSSIDIKIVSEEERRAIIEKVKNDIKKVEGENGIK